jgi:Ca-activated chloride channel homolog
MFGQNMELAQPLWLLLWLLLPLTAWWYRRRYAQHYAPIQMSNLSALSRHTSWRGQGRALLPILRAIAFALLVVAMARPQRLLTDQEIATNGIDIMLALDLSSSMLAQDFEPDRLEVAKKVAANFVQKRPNDRIGLTVFSGEAYTQTPLTSDHGVLLRQLFDLQCGFLKDGTAIGMGLANAVNRVKDSPAKSKVIVLMTDGVNNLGYFTPEQATDMAKAIGVRVYTIGIGSQGQAMTPTGRDPSDGHFLYSLAPVEIDTARLRKIAEITDGKYYRATNSAELATIYDEIDQLEKSRVEIKTAVRRAEAFGIWIFWGLALILLELLLRYSIFRTIP